MEFRILGPLEVVAAGGESLALGSAQQRAVLALLLIHTPEPVSRDRLVDELWGERPPTTAAHAVQVYVSAIRKTLRAGDGEVPLRASSAGYVLELDPERVDAKRFERLAGEAQRALAEDPSQARELFERAAGLWRGSPLAELSQFEFAGREADRLEELHAGAVEGLVEARLALAEHGEVIGQITGLVAANPLRERPRRLLMLALYRGGRHAEALAAYRDAVTALDEIGLEPSPELRQLEQDILRHDQSLGAPQRAADVDGEPSSAVAGRSRAMNGLAGTEAPAAVAVDAGERREAPPPARRRKVVTALFCDVTGSTALGEELDPEALVEVMNRYFAELRAVIERHGGTVAKFIGDAVMAVFGIPQLREDDALRAVRAAAEIRDRLPAVADEVGVALSFRTGVNTGLVLVGEGENLAIGDAVNVAARLEQAAAPGEILLGEETLRLVRDAVDVEPLAPVAVKGKSGPVRAFRLVGVDPSAPGLARHFERPLVGRERELGLLRAGWERALEESGCHLFTLLGAAGVGKSRLVGELLAGVGEQATVLRGRCLHYGEGITFWPLVEALAPVGEQAGPVLERLAGGGVAAPEELFWEVRRLLESLAVERPVMVHVDDLQWAEPMLLDLIDHVADLSRGAPILLLCTARPELLEDRPAWGGGKLNAAAVLLEPLDAVESELLLDHLGDGLDGGARARVVAASEGNPLFLEEMVVFARERGTFAVPSTIQALLGARIEGLGAEERELLERGAVEGEVFHRLGVKALCSERLAAQVERRLAGLVRKELIRPHPATLEGDEAFRFRHLLIRDAAYDGLPKAVRAELHERFADWLEDVGDGLAELDEIAGWHLEQSVRYHRELGREADPTLAHRAAEHLHAAGRSAGERADTSAARSLLERALALAPAEEPVRARIAVDLAEQLIEVGELARVDELLSAAEQDPDAAGPAELVRLVWLDNARPSEAAQTIRSRLPDILERLDRTGDHRGLARAHYAAFLMHWSDARLTAAAEHARLAAEHAHTAGDNGLRSRALGWYLDVLIQGPQDARALARELDAIEREQPGPYVMAFIDLGRAEVARLEGRFNEAHRLAESALEITQALGMRTIEGGFLQGLAYTELSAGNYAAARASLLRADAIQAESGERGFRSATQAMLARVGELVGDRAAAQAAIELAEQLGGADDASNNATTHAVRARFALADGDAAAAERWARSAVHYAYLTDLPQDQADARLELARILVALGRSDEAKAEAQAALDLHEAKGNRPGTAEAQALLDELGA